MFEFGDISFGDNVRIVRSDATTASGHADLSGVCYGLTTPSVTGVEVIGNAPDDAALNVHFDDEGIEDAWFSPELVQLIDHAAGSRATVGGREFVKGSDGRWTDVTPGKTSRRKWFRRASQPDAAVRSGVLQRRPGITPARKQNVACRGTSCNAPPRRHIRPDANAGNAQTQSGGGWSVVSRPIGGVLFVVER
jgi:hypothetical protein